MIRTTLLALGLSLAVFAPTSDAGGPGTAYCFGTSCPCDNDDPNAGCVNSSGAGALLAASGSASLSASDLSFHGTSMPTTSVSLLILGDQQQEVPFFDGKLCIGGTIQRLFKHQNTGQAGAVDFEDALGLLELNTVPITFNAGDTRHFQIWFRDAPASQSPCGKKAGVTNAYSITFQP